jgi:hypothetical protein
MKTITIIIIYIFSQILGCIDSTNPNPDTVRLNYTSYTGYYLKNTVKVNNDTTLMYYFDKKNSFDTKFGYIYDHFKPDTIPASDFEKKQILAIVKVSNNFYVMNVKEIELYGNILYVKYNCDLKASNMTWTAAIPLVITINGKYTRIKFIENGLQVGEIGLED